MKAVIFDIDGTLVDSVDLHARAWQEAFAHFGHEFPVAKIRAQIGKGGDQLLPVFLSKEEVREKGEELQEYRGDLFKRKFLREVKPFPHVRDLFQRLIGDGWKIGLASSAKADELKIYERISHIEDLVTAASSSDDAEKSKPHPDIILAAIQRLGDLPPQSCVVVGDTPYDAEAARKAGARAVGFRCGGFPEEDLRRAGCEAIYQDAGDVLKKYEQSIFNPGVVASP